MERSHIGGNTAFSLEGRLLISTGSPRCAVGEPEEDWVGIYDTGTWLEADRLMVEGAWFEYAIFSSDSTRFVIASEGETVDSIAASVLSYPDQVPIETLSSVRAPVLSPNGAFLAYVDLQGRTANQAPVKLRHLFTGETHVLVDLITILQFPAFDPISFSPGGKWVGLADQFGPDQIFSVASGRLAFETAYDGRTYNHSWTRDGSHLLTSHEDVLLMRTSSSSGLRMRPQIRP